MSTDCFAWQNNPRPLVLGFNFSDETSSQPFNYSLITMVQALEQEDICKYIGRRALADVGYVEAHSEREAFLRLIKPSRNF